MSIAKKLYQRKEPFGSVIFNPVLAKYFLAGPSVSERLRSCLTTNLGFKEHKKMLTEILGRIDVSTELPRLIEIRNPIINKNHKYLSAPLKAFFNITKRCNLHCVHCFNDSGQANAPELPLNEVIKTLYALQDRGIFKLTLAGGEPLFHSRFIDILNYIANTDLSVSIVTNATLLNRDLSRRLEEIPNVRSITVSLDGGTPEENDRIRGNGAFNKTVQGIKLLGLEFTGDVSVRISLMTTNIDRLQGFVDLVADLGVREIKVNSINPYGRASNRHELLISNEVFIEARQRLFEIATTRDIVVQVPAHKYQCDENQQIGLCRAGEETFEIDGDGGVYPCSFSFGRFLAGNVRNESFDEIFLKLQNHSINNDWCYLCKGRGGKAEKTFGYVPNIINIMDS